MEFVKINLAIPVSRFMADWKPLMDFLHEAGKNVLTVCNFDDQMMELAKMAKSQNLI